MSCIGILVSKYVEIAWLDEDADGGDVADSLIRFQIVEILVVEDDTRCFILSGDNLLLVLVLEYHIVIHLDGWLEFLVGDDEEIGTPLHVFFCLRVAGAVCAVQEDVFVVGYLEFR